MPDDRPNIIVITCHDLGRYLGCYGASIETPKIDTLAADGVKFDNYFVTSPQCSPSRGSFFTGRFPHVNGLMGLAHGSWDLHDEERILPQYLDNAGYETHLFGLQHIAQDTDRLEYDYVHSEGNLYPGVSPSVHQVNRAGTVSDVVCGFLETDRFEEPFFASIGFFELHRLQEDNGRFGFDAGYYGMDDPDEVQPLAYLPDRRGIRHDLAEMHGMVYEIDDAVGEICGALDNAGIADDTLVVFTTEHGIAFPRAKGSCYDAGLEAALIMRYPGLENQPDRIDTLLSGVDVLPTLLELLDLQSDKELNGRSFLPLLTEADEYTERDHIFAEMTWHDMYNPVRAIRTERFKYIRNFWHLPEVYLPQDTYASEAGREVRESFGTPARPYRELYDLRNTPQEDENVIHEPRYVDARTDLEERLREWMELTNDPLLDGPIVPGDFDEITRWQTGD